MIKVFCELKITAVLKKTIHHLQSQQYIGEWINRAQLTDSYLKQIHYDKKFKQFVFSNLYPLERDGIYQHGRCYVITMRSSQEHLLNRIRASMERCYETEFFQLVACEQKIKRLSHIMEITTITPAIVTISGEPWVKEKNIEILLQQLHSNAEKKFKDLYPDAQHQGFQPFIQSIFVENRKPIATAYKGHKLVGNKLRLIINDDEYSQKLAQVVLGSGLGEKGSSIGAGFCLAKGLE